MDAGWTMLKEMVIDGVEIPEDGARAEPADDALTRAAQGDQHAFATLYDLLSARVFSLIMRVVIDRALSEEVLQDVFLEVWRTAPTFVPERGSARAWVLTIAHRRAIDRVRAVAAARRRDETVGMREHVPTQPSVEEEAELAITGSRAATALAALPEPQRRVITLAYYGGYTQREIAVLVDAPLGTVKTRIRDGLSRLRVEMEATA